MEQEIAKDYEQCIRNFLIERMVRDPLMRKIMEIDFDIPLELPICLIRAPVPWHQSKVIATHFMEHDLFIGNDVARAIRSIWNDR